MLRGIVAHPSIFDDGACTKNGERENGLRLVYYARGGLVCARSSSKFLLEKNRTYIRTSLAEPSLVHASRRCPTERSRPREPSPNHHSAILNSAALIFLRAAPVGRGDDESVVGGALLRRLHRRGDHPAPERMQPGDGSRENTPFASVASTYATTTFPRHGQARLHDLRVDHGLHRPVGGRRRTARRSRARRGSTRSAPPPRPPP